MNIGLSLSGGGARGIAHLGVLKALEERNIRPSVISGTSAGALIGAIYSYGFSPEEIFDIVSKTRVLTSIKPSLSIKGLLKPETIGDILKQYITTDNFDALKIPLTVTATNIVEGKSEYFSSGELIRPIMASCCVPFFFTPVTIAEKTYVDGGLLDNLPSGIIRDKCDYLIGVSVNPVTSQFDPKNMKVMIERSLLIAINGNTMVSKERCDLVIEPEGLGDINGLELKKAKKMFEIGYECAMSILEKVEV